MAQTASKHTSDQQDFTKAASDAHAHKLANLRLNFGLPDSMVSTFLKSDGRGRAVVRLLYLSLTPFVKLLFSLIQSLPWKLKNKVALIAWHLWVRLHRALPNAWVRRGMSDSLSLESHAMNNVLWWTRLLPCPLWTVRFGLSQLSVQRPPSDTIRVEQVDLPQSGVRGAYLHTAPSTDKQPNVLMWFFGGAFVGGDVNGNMGIAEHYGRQLKCDVFIPDMRLCPEYRIQDAVSDAYRAYGWLLERVAAEQVMMLGISSGGGTALRLCQLARAPESERLEYFGEAEKALPQPAGAVLLGPFVKYDEATPSMQQYTRIDWIVNQSVKEAIEPLRSQMCGGADNILQCSPLYHSMEGLCPLMISVSEHECLIDEDTMLARKATEAGVDVEVHVQPHMPHVYQLLAVFLPEAKEAEERIMAWVRSKGGAWA